VIEFDCCQCCGDKDEDLKFGICFHCMNCESVIGLGEDAYEKPIKKMDGYTEAMARLKYVMENHPCFQRERPIPKEPVKKS